MADYHSVEDGAAVVQTALDAFGCVDIVINNAGILRDKSFAKMTEQDWDLVQAVHLRGAFQVSRAAFPHLKAQKYGRIIFTSSVAGIYGNFGQANYSAAKLGVHGLSQTLAREGGRYGIHSNTVAPMGGTRLTEDILPPDLFAGLKPELVAPLVAWLCHEECTDNGGLFEAAGGWFGKYRFERSQGAVCRGGLHELVTPEAVRERWEDITSFEGALHPTSNEEAGGLLAMMLEDLQQKDSRRHNSSSAGGGAALSGAGGAIGYKQDPVPFTYTSRDVILYALGVGVSTRDPDHLKFLYEGSEDFTVLPTFAIIASQASVLSSNLLSGGAKGWTPNLAKLLHGEQHLEMLRPLPPDGATLYSTLEVEDVLDKRTGAVIVIKVTISNEAQETVATTQWMLYIAGEGKFGGARSSDSVKALSIIPDRAPDSAVALTTSPDQAALYRMSGDLNPLHIDPSFAAMGGFKQPILHGLCSLGIAVRAVISEYCGGDPSKVKAVKTRFVKPVLPGQTLTTEMWKDGSRVIFRCVVKESGEACLTGGYVDLTSAPSDSPAKKEAAPSDGGAGSAIFQQLAKRVTDQGPALANKVRGRFLFNITVGKKQEGQWTVDLKEAPGAVYAGPPKEGRPDVTLTLEQSVLEALVEGKLNPQKAFMGGQLKVAGNIMLSQKLQDLFDTNASKM